MTKLRSITPALMVLIIFFLNSVIDAPFITYLGILICILIVILSNERVLLISYYIFLPNIEMMVDDRFPIAISSIFLILVFLKFLFQGKLVFSISIAIKLLLYLLFSTITHYLNNSDYSIIFTEIRIISNFLLAVSVLNQVIANKIYINELEDSFVYGTLLVIIFSVIYLLLKSVVINEFRLRSINGDPNYLGVCITFSILILSQDLKEFSISNSLLVIFLFIAGLLTQSRGFIVMVFPLILYLLFNIYRNRRYRDYMFLVSIPIIILGLLLLKTISLL